MKQIESQSSASLHRPARRFTFPTQGKFLSQAVLLEEAGPPRVPTLVCLLGFSLVLVAILTSAFVKIDIVSASIGEITTAIPNQVIQSFDGGIVEHVHVKKGQVVNVGDLVVTLKDPDAESQLKHLEARYSSLIGQLRRFQRLAGIKPSDDLDIEPPAPLLQIEQMSILPLNEAAISAERALLRAEIYRRELQLAGLNSMKKSLISNIDLARDQLEKQTILYEKNIIQESTIIGLKTALNNNDLQLAEIESQSTEVESSIIENRRRLENTITSNRQRYGDEISSSMVSIAELSEQINALRIRLERATIKATVKSIAHDILAKYPGQIIAPGDKVVELIPIETDFLVEARLPTNEVGHVSKGQEANISIDGIEPHRAGYLKGQIIHISPSTFIDDQGLPYYQVSMDLNERKIANTPLVPGMTVKAQIKTGQRTILEYLLKPIYRAWDSAFKER